MKAKHFLIITLALCLGLMVATVVWQRISSPSLVTHVSFQGMQQESMPPASMPEDNDSDMGRLMRMVGEDPDNIEKLAELGSALVAQGKYREAGLFLERARKLDPNDADVLYYLGYIAHQEGDTQKGAALMEESLKQQDRATVHFSLANMYRYYLKDEESAARHFSLGLKSPDCTEEQRTTIAKEMKKEQGK
ncbi:MAG: tetratricopeptide repeat protein [Desulfovibrionaceae bacterium]|nr:tetratricopeptide repeat protein [Desulfovibrionaceae bacterium]